MIPHRRVSENTLYGRTSNNAQLNIAIATLDDLAASGCEVCGRTLSDMRHELADVYYRHALLRILPCEDLDLACTAAMAGLLDVHVVCSTCHAHPLVHSAENHSHVRCLHALTEADKTLIALGADDAR